MNYKDLREWIADLDRQGELLRIKDEVRLEPDIGAASKAICDIVGPGLLFENVMGYNTPVSSLLHGSPQRVAMAMGLPRTTSFKEQKRHWMEAYDRYPVKPRFVDKKDAPCKENILHGDNVDLFKFPIHRLNTQDAGPYIIKVLCITKDPESDWVSFGIFRLQVLGRNKTSIMTSHTSHWGEHYTKARRLGKRLEMAVAVGVDPLLMLVSAAKVPGGWNEFAFAGAIRQEPVDVIMAESVNLPVPASAEIVLEGSMTLDPNVFEGPFGEFQGSYSSCFHMPTFEITTITHRNDPIYDTVYEGRGRNDPRYMLLPPVCASMEQELKHNCPSITEIAYLDPVFQNCVVQGRWVNKTEPRRVMNAIWSAESNPQSKMVTVVDEDIDPWNAEDVMWAIATRAQANTDFVMIPGAHCRLDAAVEADGTTCLIGIDATRSREPYPRHKISEWILPPEGTDTWKERLLNMLQSQGGK